MAGPCADLRVIDLSRTYPGALASMVLADAGAEVVKIEPPGGDPTRRQYASVMWHRGKKSVVLDLKAKSGRDAVLRLAGTADVLLESFRPGVADCLGFGHAAIADINPRLVYCSITGFGPRGPLANVKGYEGVVDAAVGRHYAFHGMVKKDGPVFASLAVGCYSAAMIAIQGIMASLHVRHRCGRGQKVDTSIFQGLTCIELNGWLVWQLAQRGGEPMTKGYVGGAVPPYMTARTRDGRWLQFGNLTVNTQWGFLNALGLTHLLEDPRYKTMPTYPSPEDQAAVQRLCLQTILTRDRDEWMRLFMENDVAVEPIRTTQEGLQHEQVVQNGDMIELDDPVVGRTCQLAPLAEYSETPLKPGGPTPAVGQNSLELLAEENTAGSLLDAPKERRRGDAPASANHRQSPAQLNTAGFPKYPLSGLTVLEFATFIAAPLMTAFLADLGARVIKVEPITGDLYRGLGFPKMCKTLQTKEGLALDMKDSRAREAVHRLVKKADIVVHNFRPGVPERLGIDYNSLRAIKPGLIYVCSTTYGSRGLHAHRPGFHPIAGAVAGNAKHQMGSALPPPPDMPMTLEEVDQVSTSLRRANEPHPDPVTALASAAAVLMAVYARDRTGKGQNIDVSMIRCNLYANADDAISYMGRPDRMLVDKDYNGLHALYRLYRASEGWVFLACLEERDWQALCPAMGLDPLLLDPRFKDRQSRLQNDDALAPAIEAAFLHRKAAEWQTLLIGHDLACAEVFEGELGEFVHVRPWAQEEGFMAQADHPSLGRYWRYAAPLIFSACSTRAGPPIYVGENTRALLAEAGLAPIVIDALFAERMAVQADAQKGS